MSNINAAYFSNLSTNSLTEDQKSGEVCIANISPRERQMRLQFAVWQFIITIVILVVLIALHLNPLWRLLLFFLFSASTSSFFQAHDET
jgi:hypothetical protein